MLDFLPKLVELLLSNSAGWMPQFTTAPPLWSSNAQILTHNPSTLAFAIVGVVTFAVYFAVSGWRNSRRDDTRTSPPRQDASKQQPAGDTTETPRRGAA
jgi:hypothetical protein